MGNIFLSCSVLMLAQICVAETWITINDKPIELTPRTSCSRVARGKIQPKCDCCLLQNHHVLAYNAAESAMRCTTQFHCAYDEDIVSRLERADEEVKHAQQRLNAMSIVDVDKLEQSPHLPKDGLLSSDDVTNILAALQRYGHLKLPSSLFDTSANSDMKLFVKPLGDSKKGVYSGQLFFVGYSEAAQTKPLYILKETKKGPREISHLYKINMSRLKNERTDTYALHFGNATMRELTIAHIAFDDLHFTLTTNGITRYFSLLQTAPGKSVNKHLRDFGKIIKAADTDVYEKELARMHHLFFRLGEAMSKLHQAYADPEHPRKKPLQRTFVHGDLHSENIFFDDESDVVTLIDNETFALSLRRTSLGVDDIVEFYMMHTLKTIAHTVASQLTSNTEFGIDDELWHELWCSLFDGYLAAYHPRSQKEFDILFYDFKNKFYQGLSQLRVFISPHAFLDQRKLKRFGPTIRRAHIKHHELRKTFKQLYRINHKRLEAQESGS
jgi:hypothetical protein